MYLVNEDRIEKLTAILKKLNDNVVTEEVRGEALNIVANIDPIELSVAEQRLIEQGMDPQELRNLCDIHMEVLSDELVKLKKKIEPGHMLDTLIIEHDKIKEFLMELEELNKVIQALDSYSENPDLFKKLENLAINILDAEKHHKREEDVLFPELEKRNITGPTRIMRMEHDDLRKRKRMLKETAHAAANMDFSECKIKVDELAKYIVFHLRDHIYKENYILYPTAMDALKDKALWEEMKHKSDEIGYCPFTPGK
ncbi:DUF438 domain-containing protein [Clostridium sp. 19966]|uniref:DUF438 domain-containing protein n=1 Tax=Clostridium sp. 19966 TaxID=2768166 RepID=UPI0028DEEC44|nr:DUF438 domain-containing protein [Clostridium sp. 19966]MDT8718802.1 DUF438 domain-containing protein [Clostridium sp. 19966]